MNDSSGEAPAPDEGATPSDQHTTLSGSVNERLTMLDELYSTGKITAIELRDARGQVLAGTTTGMPAVPAPADTQANAAPPPPPPAPTEQVTAPVPLAGDGEGPPPKGPTRTIAGLPLWAAGAIGAAVIAAIIVGVLLLAGGGGDDDAEAAGAQEGAAAYAAQINRPLDQLTKSAVATGKSLARVSEPADIRQLNRTVERQLDVVEGARSSLTRVRVLPTDERAHRALITAAADQRRYLVALARASSGTANEAKLKATNRARRAGGETIVSYRTFFRLAPEAPDAITTTDLADTSGLTTALKDSIQSATPPVSASSGTPARSSTYSSSSFQSPTGNLRCEVLSDTLFCSSSNDGFGVVLNQVGEPTTGSGTASGGQVVPYGSSWRSGVFTCDSAYTGVTCRNASGNGFFLNRDTYNPF